MARKDILRLLAGGDRRSIGQAEEVVALVRKAPQLFPQLISGMRSEESVLRMRAADVVEKVTRERPELLRPYKDVLLGLLAQSTEKEVRWHLAAIVPRLRLGARERRRALSLLTGYLQDGSSIVKTLALEGLVDLSRDDGEWRIRVVELLRESARNGSAAMKARSRKLLKRFGEGQES